MRWKHKKGLFAFFLIPTITSSSKMRENAFLGVCRRSSNPLRKLREKIKIRLVGQTLLNFISAILATASLANANGPVAYYRLDETAGAVVQDASGNGNTGTNYGAVTGIQGKVGTAYDFNGTSAYVSVPHSASLNITGTALTLGAWVYPRSGTGTQIFVNKEYAYEMGIVNGKFQFAFMSGGKWKGWYGSTGLVLNQWQHVSVSYDGAAVRFYLDGLLKETVAASGGIDASTQPLGLGGRINTGSWTSFFNGQLDEVKVWNWLLTYDEVWAEAGRTGPAGQLAYYRLDEVSGTVVGDASGNGNTGTAVNGVLMGQGGKLGTAYSFDGVNDYVSVPHSSSLNITGMALTMQAWVYPRSGTGTQIFANKEYAYEMGIVNGKFQFAFMSGGKWKGWYGSTGLVLNQWQHVSVSYDGAAARFYLDGLLKETVAASGGIDASTQPLGLGGRINTGSWTSFFNGQLDEVKVWNRVLTNDEVWAEAGFSGQAGQVATYRLDEVSGTAVADASGNGNTGTAVNGVLMGQEGKLGTAYSFDGVDDYVSVPHSASLNITGTALTLEAWVYPLSGTGSQILINKEYAYEIAMNDGMLQGAFLSGGMWKGWYGSTALALNQWQHVAVSYDGAAMRFYLDGVLKETVTASGGIDASTQPLGLGARIWTGSWAYFFNGKLDELKVWKRVLSDSEVAKETQVLTESTSLLPSGTVGQGYSVTLSATGGKAPYSWSVTVGSLPSGLSLTASNGVISGTPSSTGISSFTATVTDAAGTTVSKVLSITINASPAITTTSLPNGVAGSAYSASLQATGGTAPLTWSVVSGVLPSGLVLSGSTILGSPTVPGTGSFIVEVRDANGAGSSQSLTITIDPAPLVITTGSLPGGTLGTSYSATLTATGGVSPYTWSISSGSLPPGLSLNSTTVVISGNPTSTGTVGFTIQVMDGQGSSSQNALSITISSGLAAYYRLDEVSGTAVGDASGNGNTGTAVNGVLLGQEGKLGSAYSFDGVNDYVSVPQNATLNSNVLTLAAWVKAPNMAQNSFIVTKRDPSGNYAQYSLGVTGADSYFTKTGKKIAFLFRQSGTVERGAYTTADIVDGNWHHVAAVANPSSGTLTIYIDGQSVAITVDHNAGAWPNTATTQPVAIGQNNGNGLYFNGTIDELKIYSRALTATEVARETQVLTQTTSLLPSGTVGKGYGVTLSATGGTAPYSWSVTGGSLPAGLSLGATTGVISGTPTTTGISGLTVTVTDAAGTTVSKVLSITINASPTITTTSLPNGMTGSTYSASLQATGGTAPLTWSVVSGVLPSGLVLSGSTILGTPTVTGTGSFIVEVRDANGAGSSQSLTITIDPAPLVITTGSLPGGTLGTSYSATLTATGGVSPYTWTTTTGSLPPGLTLSPSSGAISGTPTAAGSYAFTALVSDAVSNAATKSFTVGIVITPVRIEDDDPAVLYGGSWQQKVDANASKGKYMNSSNNPASLNYTFSGTGVSWISDMWSDMGIANVYIDDLLDATVDLYNGAGKYQQTVYTKSGLSSGTHTIKIEATGTKNPNSTGTLIDLDALDVIPSQDVTILTSTLPGGTLGTSYSATLTASGGVRPYTWAITAGSLPPGLTLSPSSGAVSGTPTASGSYSVTVLVSDAVSNAATKSFTVGIVVSPIRVEEDDPAIGYGGSWQQRSDVNASKGKYMNTSNNLASLNYTFSGTGVSWISDIWSDMGIANVYIDGLLDATVDLYSGAGKYQQTVYTKGGLSSGTHTIKIEATGTKNPNSAGTLIDLDAFDVIPTQDLTILTSTLPGGTINKPYAAGIAASGGTPPLTWSISSGSLPAGLVLDGATGSISGTPTNAQTASFTVRVLDAAGTTSSRALSLTINPSPVVTTTSLPNGSIGVSYSVTLTVSGGTAPYTWTVSSGSLPAGLSLNGATITGTPTVTGTYSFTIQVTDANGAVGGQGLNLKIDPAPLTVTTTSVTDGTVGKPYTATITASGGTPPLTWSISSGSLPAGLVLDGATGSISGTPTYAQTTNFTVQALDATGTTSSRALSLTINPSPFITTTSLPNGSVGVAYSMTVAVSGGTAPYAWTVSSGSLPAGLSLNGSTISGTPTTTGAFSFTIRVTDTYGAVASQSLSLNVDETPVGISTAVLPDGTVGSAYRFVLRASGGTPGYTWSLAAGTVPAGISLSASGVLSGTPSSSGTTSFTVQVMDATGRISSNAFSMTVNASSTWATGMEIYASLTSVTPGNSVDFHVSTGAATFDLNIYREGASRTFITAVPGLVGRSYAIPNNGSEAGYAWPTAYTLTIPSNWTSGVYVAEAVSGTLKNEVIFVVKAANPGNTSKVLLKLVVNTYQTYNDAGGKSLYDFLSTNNQRANRLSFERPYHSTKDRNCNAYRCYGNYFNEHELMFVRWLESNGYVIEYATDVDLHGDSNLLKNYRLLLSIGHDEYWSKEMRDQVEGFVNGGGNVAFFSGNVSWWQVRYENSNHGIVCYKNYQMDPLFGVDNSRVTYNWYNYPVNRPENTTTGLSFRYGGYPSSGGYTTYNSNHWVFQTTGLSNGQVFGSAEKIVGYEVDGTQFSLDANGIPWVSGNDGTPLQFTILGLAAAVDPYDGKTPRNATMGIFTKNGGGTVFNAASVDWAYGLSTNYTAQQITKNVIDKLSQPVDPSPRIVTESLRSGAVNQAYKSPVIAGGGLLPYTWTLQSGNLPPGLSLDPSTGEITGTPTASGSYSFTIQMRDANSLTDSKSLSISVNAVTVRYEETNSSISYVGTWQNVSNANTSGGNYKNSGDSATPASVTLTFTGTQVNWISDVWSDLGIANVYIDGVLSATVDLYSATGKYQQTVYSKTGLSSGTHTLKIETTGAKNPSSSGGYIDIDAFDVLN